jgi:hypothetical protein
MSKVRVGHQDVFIAHVTNTDNIPDKIDSISIANGELIRVIQKE